MQEDKITETYKDVGVDRRMSSTAELQYRLQSIHPCHMQEEDHSEKYSDNNTNYITDLEQHSQSSDQAMGWKAKELLDLWQGPGKSLFLLPHFQMCVCLHGVYVDSITSSLQIITIMCHSTEQI